MTITKNFVNNSLRVSLRLLLFGLIVSSAYFLNGCTTAEEEIDHQRIKDSLEVYSNLDKAFTQYILALNYAEKHQDDDSKSTFEKSLKTLNAIDYKLLDAPGNIQWRLDFNELSKSIVQDYLSSQENISENSLVFKFADELNITFTEIKEMEETDFINEPLPDGSDLPLVRNSAVDSYIEFFTNTERGRNFIDRTSYRSGKFFPILRKILRYHNTPEENIYLSIQESGLDPRIVSRAGAVGLWQFMPATGAAYGLFQDTYRDDRRDFEKSTDAAARHLNDLYRSFGDWYLAWAAYNAGPGRVNTAIRRSGSRDFWVLRNNLPGETKNYVPSILALSYVYRFPEQYGFNDLEYANPLSFDRVMVHAELTFDQIARMTDSDLETIRELNPELFDDAIPVYDVPYMVRIPHGTYEKFARAFESSGDFRKLSSNVEFAGDERFSVGSVASIKFAVGGYNPPDPRGVISTNGKQQVNHQFENGEMLSSIAIRYRVRATDIRIWNNLNYGRNPAPKQNLIIYTMPESTGLNETVSPDESETTTSETITSQDNLTTIEENNSDLQSPSIRDFHRKRTGNTDNIEQPNYKTETTFTEENETVTNPVSENTSTQQVVTENVTAPKTNTTTNTTTRNTTRNNPTGKQQSYTVKEGDMLSTIASRYGVRVNDIMDWNNLDGDKILIGQRLTIYSDRTVSNENTSTQVHTVATGENLTLIANKYNVSINDLMNWNNLSSDVIHVGQKITLNAQKTSGRTNTTKQLTYTVKSGDNLTKIAQSLGVSLSKLKEWNNLSDDVIKVGQVLKYSK